MVKIRLFFLYIMSALWQWKEDVWKMDLDGLYCCDGKECSCGGLTNREALIEAGALSKSPQNEDNGL